MYNTRRAVRYKEVETELLAQGEHPPESILRVTQDLYRCDMLAVFGLTVDRADELSLGVTALWTEKVQYAPVFTQYCGSEDSFYTFFGYHTFYKLHPCLQDILATGDTTKEKVCYLVCNAK